jgi:hypothetical protein
MHAYMQQKCRHENYFWHKKNFVCFKWTCCKIFVNTVLRNNVISWNFALKDAICNLNIHTASHLCDNTHT